MASDDPNAEKKQPPAAETVEVVTEENPVESKQVKEEKTTTTNHTNGLPDMRSLTVEELYDKDKYDMSTMEPGDVFTLLQ